MVARTAGPEWFGPVRDPDFFTVLHSTNPGPKTEIQ